MFSEYDDVFGDSSSEASMPTLDLSGTPPSGVQNAAAQQDNLSPVAGPSPPGPSGEPSTVGPAIQSPANLPLPMPVPMDTNLSRCPSLAGLGM